jgi:hypothetical protein
MNVQEFLSVLRAQDWPFNDGLSKADIRGFEQQIGVPIPPELHELYLDHDGEQEHGDDRVFHLMPHEQVVEFYADVENAMPEHLSRWLMKEFSPLFWTSFNSDYAGVHLSGPKKGRVFILQHDGDPQIADRYSSIPLFLDALASVIESGGDWHDEMREEYR